MFYGYRQRRAALRMSFSFVLLAALIVLFGIPAQF